MSKQEEIKQALAAATPGPWVTYKWSNDERYAVYQSPVSQKTAITGWGSVTQSKENAHLIAKAPEYIAYLLEEVEQQPELWECHGCGFTYDACHEDIDPATGEGNGNHTCPLCELIDVERERDRLRKELEEARKILGFYADKKNYYQEKVLYDENDPLDCYYEAPEVQNDQGERARAFLVGQEGEGNQ